MHLPIKLSQADYVLQFLKVLWLNLMLLLMIPYEQLDFLGNGDYIQGSDELMISNQVVYVLSR